MGRWVAVGRISRAHGVRGETSVQRYGDSSEVLEAGRSLTARGGGRDVPLTVAESRPAGGSHWLVRFEGIEDRDAADALRGLELTVDESELPPLPEGRYYRFQILGLRAVTPEGEVLGTVEEIWETGANDVYVVRGGKGEILLPVIEQVIGDVDLERQTITVTPLPGLIPEEEAP